MAEIKKEDVSATVKSALLDTLCGSAHEMSQAMPHFERIIELTMDAMKRPDTAWAFREYCAGE